MNVGVKNDINLNPCHARGPASLDEYGHLDI